MEINVVNEAEYTIVKLIGNLIEGPNTGDFVNIIDDLIKDNVRNIIIDTEKVTYANSTGLSVLFNAYRKLDKKGGKLIIINLNNKFKKLLSITKFDTLFEIYNDLESAAGGLKD